MPTSSAAAMVGLTYVCSALLCLPRIDGFRPVVEALQLAPISSTSAASTTALHSFKWPELPSLFAAPTKKIDPTSIGDRNGLSPEYPWRFEGRFMFRPSLVRVTGDVHPPSSKLLSLFGYSLGGSVALEYDVSPVGPYREYVTMGGLVGLGQVAVGDASDAEKDADPVSRGRTLGLGQWGTDLYVSTQVAEDVCRRVWGVPVKVADIRFVAGDENGCLADGSDGHAPLRDEGARQRTFTISGWEENARILRDEDMETKRYGNVPVCWTPTIKALWAPWLLPSWLKGATSRTAHQQLLPLHKLRLSASALRLKRCKRVSARKSNCEGEIPLGVALVVDNVLIEIGEQVLCE